MNKVKLDTLKRLATELNTEIVFGGSGFVREPGDDKYIRRLSMYRKLIKRRQTLNAKNNGHL